MKVSWGKALIVIFTVLPLVALGMALVNIVRHEKVIRAAANVSVTLPPIGEAPKTDDPKILAGWKVYTGKGCVYCHGPGATGGVKNPNAVGGLMPPLNKVGGSYTKEELKKKIRKGVHEVDRDNPKGPHPPLFMPNWEERLSAQELDDVSDYLMNLLPKEEKEGW